MKAKELLSIDGSMGEGGGQVLRSSLTLAGLLRQPVSITAIRGGRKKPGLMRQHLTALRAAATVCEAELEGDFLHSQAIVFRPSAIRGGTYTFAIGSGGSCTLVAQTILPILLRADHPSEIIIEGGTHVPSAPSGHFFQQAYLPALRRTGVNVHCTIERVGFMTSGGGCLRIQLHPVRQATPLVDHQRGELQQVTAFFHDGKLPAGIIEREQRKLRTLLSDLNYEEAWKRYAGETGSGNAMDLLVQYNHCPVMFSACGFHGKRAERVAEDVAKAYCHYRSSKAVIDEMLADQLMVPLVALAGGSYTTSALSLHSATNLAVLSLFGFSAQLEGLADGLFKIIIPSLE